jgi:hypothetical protein
MTGQGQAEVSNPDQSPKGTERQAVSGPGQAEVNNPVLCSKVQDGRQAQCAAILLEDNRLFYYNG